MSQLSQLKSAIDGVAKSASTAGKNLSQFERQFNQQAQSVQQIMGGGAQGKDRAVLDAIAQASSAVKQATEALNQAGRIASQYGQSL